MARARGLTRLEVVVLLVVASFAVSLLAARNRLVRSIHDEKKCSNVLRSLGMACINYVDDKRFFPHSPPIPKLAGGVESDEASFAAGLLVRYDYALPEQFICPSTCDERASEAPKRQPLAIAHDLSYGYTRFGLTQGSRSTRMVFADRSRRIVELEEAPKRAGPLRGNHSSAILVVCVDARTRRITPESDPVSTNTIAATTSRALDSDGFMGVLGDR